jgi:hypothetical protein
MNGTRKQMEPRGLERAYCEVCDATFTVAKGRCTGCIRREENRKQGVVYLVFGGGILALVALAHAVGVLPGFGIFTLITGCIGLSIAAKGLQAVVSGRSAESL